MVFQNNDQYVFITDSCSYIFRVLKKLLELLTTNSLRSWFILVHIKIQNMKRTEEVGKILEE